MPIKIVSFGFRHGNRPTDGKVIDVRHVFNRNPFHNKRLRGLTGLDEAVQRDINLTPGFLASWEALYETVRSCKEPVVYLGCTGGHHRSVYLAQSIGDALGLIVRHRDIRRR